VIVYQSENLLGSNVLKGFRFELVQRPLLERLRNKIAKRKRKRNSKSLDESNVTVFTEKSDKMKGNVNAVRVIRRIEVGWMDFDSKSKMYKQVRIQNGGGLRQMSVNLSCTMADVRNNALLLFFPGGNSKKGRVDEFEFEVCTADNVVIENCTVGEIYERTKVKRLRLNIRSMPIRGLHETATGMSSESNTTSQFTANASSANSLYESDSDDNLVSILRML
jgi:hypothetical protein